MNNDAVISTQVTWGQNPFRTTFLSICGKILMSYGKNETKDITDISGWKKGSVAVALNQLIKK